MPDEAWTQAPVDVLARGYDQVDAHGWYANLDPTVRDLARLAQDGSLLLDYSGGTGILAGRLLRAVPDRRFLLVIVDASAKFLRLALEKFRDEPRVGFRHLPPRPDGKGLRAIDEVAPDLVGRIDAVACTNAIHLYPQPAAVAVAWARMLRPGGKVLVQSGNIGRDPGPVTGATATPWIIDDTVSAVQAAAAELVRGDARYARFRAVLDDKARMAAHAGLRQKYFLPTRPAREYVHALQSAGLHVDEVLRRPVAARTQDWFDFLKVYHDGVLGWVGGVEKVEGKAPSAADVEARLEILHEALARVLGGQESFQAEWTYLTATKPGA